MVETAITSKSATSKAPIKKIYRVISMFSGCGGMDLGFRGGFSVFGKTYSKHPFRIVWANDLNEAACRTYRRNLDSHIKCGDVWQELDTLPESTDILIGGFPCQDISVNGKGAGIDGKRSGLYRAMVEAIRRTRPKIFVAENVKGLLMKHNKNSLEAVLRDFKGLGYDVTYQLYHAADYGVPQTRERVIIVGTALNIGAFKPPSPPLTKKEWVSAHEAIADLENAEENAEFSHIWSKAEKSSDQGNRRLKADRPAHTMRAECHGNIQFHYKLKRRISMREAARFQSFPDNYIFDAKLRETERQIGNAVPPVLAWHIAEAVADALKRGGDC
ncbi:MAG: DNA cytosine methyltransferase [Bdellovibrionales bacterium]